MLGDPQLAVLALSLEPQGSCFHPRLPHISSELTIG